MVGSLTGALASVVGTWMNQNGQIRAQLRLQEVAKREDLYFRLRQTEYPRVILNRAVVAGWHCLVLSECTPEGYAQEENSYASERATQHAVPNHPDSSPDASVTAGAPSDQLFFAAGS